MKRVSVAALLGFAVAGILPHATFAQGFGGAVAVAGDQVLVAQSRGPDGGTVYIYTMAGGGWVEAGSIISPEPAQGDGFGTGLAVSGGRLLVTASPGGGGRRPGGRGGAGAGPSAPARVYVFERTGSTWTAAGMLAPEGLPEGVRLGAVATDGDLAAAAVAVPPRRGPDNTIIRNDGMIVVFRNRGGEWIQEAVLESPRSDQITAFGGSLALSGEMLVVGAPETDSLAGAVFVYEPGEGGWTMTGELSSDDGAGSFFGARLLVAGDHLLVAAGRPPQQPGQVVAFVSDGDGWSESGRLRAFDGSAGDQFGAAMTSDGSTLWVGAPGAGGGRGAIYEFAMNDGGWGSVSRLGGHRQLGEWMGTLLAHGDDMLVTGMPRDDYGLGTAMIFSGGPGGWSEGATVFREADGIEPVLGDQVDCADGEAHVFGCSDVDLVSFIPSKDMGGNRGARVNDIWGWTDPETNRDYAIVGRTDGTSFVDVTDPPNPVVVGNLPKPDWAPGSTWRDMKVYMDHVFVVSDGAANHGMQVFDLTRLREFSGTLLTFDHDAHYDRINSVHNIVINEETGFAYAVGSSRGGETCGGGLHMIDIRDPKNPTFAGCFADERTGRRGTGYSHDAQCVVYRGPDEEHAGSEICIGANENAISIADVTDKENPVALSMMTYPSVGYGHQGWLTEDHSYFFMGDETDETGRLVPNTRTLIWDLRDLDDPILVKEFFTENTASDHNLYIRGNLMFQSNYNSGLRVFDITDVENPREVGFLDTVPGPDSPSMNGSWSNYPFFNSGIVVVTSGREGLFVVKHRARMPIS